MPTLSMLGLVHGITNPRDSQILVVDDEPEAVDLVEFNLTQPLRGSNCRRAEPKP